MYVKGKGSSVPSDNQAREKLALYVYEYLLHVGAQKAASTFLSEIRWEKQISIGEPPGFLQSWWCVFWDLYCAAPERRETGEHSSEAKAFHDYGFVNSGFGPSVNGIPPGGPPPPMSMHSPITGPPGSGPPGPDMGPPQGFFQAGPGCPQMMGPGGPPLPPNMRYPPPPPPGAQRAPLPPPTEGLRPGANHSPAPGMRPMPPMSGGPPPGYRSPAPRMSMPPGQGSPGNVRPWVSCSTPSSTYSPSPAYGGNGGMPPVSTCGLMNQAPSSMESDASHYGMMRGPPFPNAENADIPPCSQPMEGVSNFIPKSSQGGGGVSSAAAATAPLTPAAPNGPGSSQSGGDSGSGDHPAYGLAPFQGSGPIGSQECVVEHEASAAIMKIKESMQEEAKRFDKSGMPTNAEGDDTTAQYSEFMN